MTAASGNVSYTGLGFTPSSCLASAAKSGNTTAVFGASDSSLTSFNTFAYGGTLTNGADFMTLFDSTVTNGQGAVMASYDTDGFTLTWTKTGSPTGTATLKFMCRN
jgi:hypothetical protein